MDAVRGAGDQLGAAAGQADAGPRPVVGAGWDGEALQLALKLNGLAGSKFFDHQHAFTYDIYLTRTLLVLTSFFSLHMQSKYF